MKSISDESKFIGMVFTPFIVKEIFDGNTPWELVAQKKDLRVKLSDEEMSHLIEMSKVYLKLLTSYGENNDCCRKMAACILSFARQCFEKTSSGSLLSKYFKSQTGYTPSQYRNEKRRPSSFVAPSG